MVVWCYNINRAQLGAISNVPVTVVKQVSAIIPDVGTGARIL
jgi:hypothetical protein